MKKLLLILLVTSSSQILGSQSNSYANTGTYQGKPFNNCQKNCYNYYAPLLKPGSGTTESGTTYANYNTCMSNNVGHDGLTVACITPVPAN